MQNQLQEITLYFSNSITFGSLPKIEDLLKEKEDILSKPKLTKKDESRLKILDEKIGFLPVSENHEDNEAMEVIRKAAKWLKTKAE